jgi:hypothetical protein
MSTGTSRPTTTPPNWLSELKPAELVPIVPIVAAGFAFAFVVGYFLAFDIFWFPFFSLSEHVVFAVRAFPIAIGASVVFLIGLQWSKIQNDWQFLNVYSIRLTYFWIFVLFLTAGVAFVGGHFALMASLIVIAVGTSLYRCGPVAHPRTTDILYWVITTMVVSLITGYLSGMFSPAAWVLDRSIGNRFFPLASSMNVHMKSGDAKAGIRGRVIFVGSRGVLFYEYGNKVTHLFLWSDIKEINDKVD